MIFATQSHKRRRFNWSLILLFASPAFMTGCQTLSRHTPCLVALRHARTSSGPFCSPRPTYSKPEET